VIESTDLRNKQKVAKSREVTERFLKKLSNPTRLSGEQAWKLFKGDNTGEEISIDFIKSVCDQKGIELDTDGFDKILLVHHEKSLRNLRSMRKDNSSFIDLATQLKLDNLPKTDDSFRYSFELDTQNRQAKFSKSGKFHKSIGTKICNKKVIKN
jgi:alanyl-tRNA synthetase